MSEPFSDNLVQSICYLMNAVFEDSSGDYLTHEQARKLRAVVVSHEIADLPIETGFIKQ
jgi:hypothetical protein